MSRDSDRRKKLKEEATRKQQHQAKRYTATQPQHGDPVIHCGHLFYGNGVAPFRFARSKGGVSFQRPDGSKGQAEWIIACNTCWHQAGQNFDNVHIRGDGTWKGNTPVIEHDPGTPPQG